MTDSLIAGLMLGLTAALPGSTLERSTQIDHQSGLVEVVYSGEVLIDQKQIGTVAPGGRPSTRRCVWKANIAVTRDAESTAGTIASRQFVRENVASGSRAGWCSDSKAAIAKEVATRSRNLDHHMMEAVQEDRGILVAELDRLHSSAG